MGAAETVTSGAALPPPDKYSTDKALDRLDRMRHAKGDEKIGAVRQEMQRAMQQYAARIPIGTVTG